ncbi:MAG: MiaB/RimO family radical SAM methylthiotransferase [Candidatus Acididesulfobacter guangdongensis]|uniref:MiaB/RimO family radical SAM methylthiotransferase n=1 Tax=Acididesulfobacter guangdongensis TaxID=2597225 RepID=A0A519BHR5_ACIG2|nr:MAG: MiaB/RimO family radical SAM methylthiotransferase [Candidatus Acididesulfobacter guangdongensis]
MDDFLNYLDGEILKLKSNGSEANCAVISSGCKLNQFEAGQFESLLKKRGFNIVDADASNIHKIDEHKIHIPLFLINTCSVTEKADNETKRMLNRIKNKYPLSAIILTGCFAQLNKETYTKAEYRNSGIKLIDNVSKLNILTNYSNDKHNNNIADTKKTLISSQKRIRANLKIQEGCDIKCSFCIIPEARPTHWSLKFGEVLSSIREYYEAGFKEIIISGMNIGSYGSSNAQSEKNFNSLLIAIEELDIPVKIRISSIDPIHFNDDLINILANSKKIQNHFHIPLQSGSNKILKAMKRNYTFEEYLTIINKINSKIKDAAIGTDIISGFPGETEEYFAETLNNLNKLDIYYMHIFSYSDRKGTEAFLMDSKIKINPKTIKQRTAILRDISSNKKDIFHKKFYGRTLNFLSLSKSQAISSNYIKGNIIYGGCADEKIITGQDYYKINAEANGGKIAEKRHDAKHDEKHRMRHTQEIPPNTFFEGILMKKDDLNVIVPCLKTGASAI